MKIDLQSHINQGVEFIHSRRQRQEAQGFKVVLSKFEATTYAAT